LAILKQSSGFPNKAVELYGRALKALPDYPDAHFNLANTLHQQGRFYEAAHHYKETMR
jgi:tetratricopeptide (TPR) repeat protein